jgi:YuzL-like protein
MSKRRKKKADPSTIGLNSPQVEGQGTTTTETGSRMEPSSRRKTKIF